MKWNSSSHPISDIRDWNKLKRLEIRPDFQRGSVWADAAKIMLMDSILNDIPMPKIFFQSIVRELDTYRILIDGQQRISAILSFLNNEFKLEEPYKGKFINKNFTELPKEIKQNFLSYKIDINEIIDADEALVREVYSRVNKYTIALNKQELRRADFPGDFLNLSEDLAINDYFEQQKVFTIANRRRMGDVEFTSELLALLISGVQEKKETLDDFYQNYSNWTDKDHTKEKFLKILTDLEFIFNEKLPICKTRFKQKSDLYSLFAVIHDFHKDGYTLIDKDLNALREDVIILNELISPESPVDKLSEYAIKCVSQANSSSSRIWRRNFLKKIFKGTYTNILPDQEIRKEFHELLNDIDYSSMCPPSTFQCPVCDEETDDSTPENVFLTWSKTESNYQISNSIFVHNNCQDSCIEYYTFDEEYE